MEAALIIRGLVGTTCAVLLSGCAAVAPFASLLEGGSPVAGTEVHTATSVKLEEGNFVTVRTNLVGSSRGFKLLGFITLRPATLSQAMDRLYVKAEAQEGRPQTLAHLIVERSGIYVILFSIPRVTARADLVEFIPAHDQEDDTEPRSSSVQRITRSQRHRKHSPD